MPSYSGNYTSGTFDLWQGLELFQPVAPSAYRTGVADAAYFGKQVQDNVLALVKSSVGSPWYGTTFACASGLTTGQPVYLSDADTVALAAASGSGTSKVVGFVRDKTSAGTGCYLAHYWRATGLTCTTGATIYLTDAGGYATTQGTFKHTIGIGIDTTGALLSANPLDATLSSPDIGGAPVAVGTGSGADSGSGTFAARYDHVHAMRTGYDDTIIPLLILKSGGSSDPTLETIGSGTSAVKLYKFATGNELFFSIETPHSYKEGSDIECHLHYMGSGSTGGTVVWQLDLQARAMTGVWTFSGTGELTFTGSGTLNTGGKAQYLSFGSITGTSLGIDSHIAGKLSRQGGTTTTAVYAMTLGFHYQMDSFGSLNQTSKT